MRLCGDLLQSNQNLTYFSLADRTKTAGATFATTDKENGKWQSKLNKMCWVSIISMWAECQNRTPLSSPPTPNYAGGLEEYPTVFSRCLSQGFMVACHLAAGIGIILGRILGRDHHKHHHQHRLNNEETSSVCLLLPLSIVTYRL